MNRQKPASKIHGFPKTKPRKRRVVFFVLLKTVLVLGLFFVSFETSNASFKMTDGEKESFKQELIKQGNSEKSSYAGIISIYENNYNSYADASKALLSNPNLGEKMVQQTDALQGDPNETSKQAALMALGGILAPIIGVLEIVAKFLTLFVYIATAFLASMLDPALYNFMGDKMITQGWTAVRDVCNLFFLLVLLFIAFCTILQIEKYHAKKTLLTFILMAMLINFSKPIAIFIFDGSQLLMNFFLNKIGTGTDFTTALGGISKIADIIFDKLPSFTEVVFGKEPNVRLAVKTIFAVIFLFMYGVAIFVMAIYLLIRIVAIQILIILAPFAFLFNAIPDFKKISSDWWDALFKYSYVGPVIAFFLWLVTLSEFTKKISDAGNYFSMQSFISFMFVLVFLYASIIVANKFGIQFASAITNRANKALNWGARNLTGYNALKWGAKAGARKFDRDILAPAGLSPRALWRGWKKVSEESEREALEPAEAKARDRWNNILRRKKPAGLYENVQNEAEIDKYKKERAAISTQDVALIDEIEKYKNDRSDEARARTAAALRLLFENNDQNEFMKQYMLTNEEFLNWFREKTGKEAEANDPETLREALRFAMERNGGDENYVGRQLFQLSNIALSKGNLANYGMGVYDRESKGYKIADNGTQGKQALGKARNIDVQEKMKRLHWNAIFEERKDNTPGGIHDTGYQLLAQMKQAEIGQLNRSRPDLIENCYTRRGDLLAAAEKLRSEGRTMEATNVKAFHDRIVELAEAKARS